MNGIKEVVTFLEKIGLTTVIIPFALTFVILFSVLQKTKVLGKEKNKNPKTKINAVVALVFGLLVVAYADTVNVVNRIAQYGTVLIIVGLIAVIIFSFAGFPKIGKTKLWRTIGFFIFAIFVLYVLGAFEYLDWSKAQTNLIVPIIAVAAFILTMYIILKPAQKEPETKKKTTESAEVVEGERRTPQGPRPLSSFFESVEYIILNKNFFSIISFFAFECSLNKGIRRSSQEIFIYNSAVNMTT